jgi:hypothetical protein
MPKFGHKMNGSLMRKNQVTTQKPTTTQK